MNANPDHNKPSHLSVVEPPTVWDPAEHERELLRAVDDDPGPVRLAVLRDDVIIVERDEAIERMTDAICECGGLVYFDGRDPRFMARLQALAAWCALAPRKRTCRVCGTENPPFGRADCAHCGEEL